MNARTLRERYVSDTVATASPARLVVMLYDRMALDLRQAEAAFESGDRGRGQELTRHASDIVCELMASLDVSSWEGAAGLMQLYTWFLKELIGAGTVGDLGRLAAVRRQIESLAEAWREAAVHLAAKAS
jgi:flagellar protein FliS